MPDNAGPGVVCAGRFVLWTLVELDQEDGATYSRTLSVQFLPGVHDDDRERDR
jgi:hypothetical protein